MAKGAYSFVAYPESADIEKITQKLTEAGAEWSYILHDKDVYLEDKDDHKKGDLLKAHWHIVAGWETGFPNWRTFKALCSAVGAVAISYRVCFVTDCEGCTDYFTHPNQPDKYQYKPEEVHSSENFDCDAYQLADTRRKKMRKDSKVEKLCSFQEILVFIEDNQITNWATLLRTVSQKNPEYLETCLQYGYGLQGYLNSLKDRETALLIEAHKTIDDLKIQIENLENELGAAYNQISAESEKYFAYDLVDEVISELENEW